MQYFFYAYTWGIYLWVGVIFVYDFLFTGKNKFWNKQVLQSQRETESILHSSPPFHSIFFPFSLWEILFTSAHERFIPFTETLSCCSCPPATLTLRLRFEFCCRDILSRHCRQMTALKQKLHLLCNNDLFSILNLAPQQQPGRSETRWALHSHQGRKPLHQGHRFEHIKSWQGQKDQYVYIPEDSKATRKYTWI